MFRNFGPILVLAGWLAAPTAARAQGAVQLGWSDCAPAGEFTGLLEYGCASNLGFDVLVVSFRPPDTLRTLVRLEARIDMFIAAAALGPWNHYEVGACRAGSLNVSAAIGDAPTVCEDPWQGTAHATYEYAANFPENLDLGRLNVTVTLPAGGSIRVDPGHEYAAFRVTIDHWRAVGANRCPNCIDEGCWQLEGMTLKQSAGPPPITISNGFQTAVRWQSADFACPNPTPARHPTWGAIKSLYR